MSGTITMTGKEYDALHAEAEALRAENGRLRPLAEDRDQQYDMKVKARQQRDEMRAQLEAARGLLRDIYMTCNLREMPSEYAIRDISNQIEALLTATHAPEVQELAMQALSAENQRVVPPGPIIAPPHPFDKPSLLKDCNVSYSNSSRPLAELGERQEAVAWGAFHFGGNRNGKLYAHCETEEQIESYIADLHRSNDSITLRKGPLYTTPQPGPDVRGLVEALEQCAASLAWNCFGECRAVHAGPIMPAAKALDTARAALAATGLGLKVK